MTSQIACVKQFQARYPGSLAANVGNHPNAYAEEALSYLRAAADASAGGAAAAASSSPAGKAGGGTPLPRPHAAASTSAVADGTGGEEFNAADLTALDALGAEGATAAAPVPAPEAAGAGT